MRFFIITLLSVFMFSSIGISYANSDNQYTIPFNHVEVEAFKNIRVNYDLNSNRQLACKTDSGINDGIYSFTTIQYTAYEFNVSHHGGWYKQGLPIILTHQRGIEGYLADSNGQLIITNEFGVSGNEDTSTYVSCEYRN